MYGGGAERSLIELLGHLDHNKYNVTLLTLHKYGINLQFIPKWIKVKCLFEKSRLKIIGRIISSLKYRIWYKQILKHPTFIHKLILREKYDFEIAFTEGIPLSLLKAKTKAHKIARLCTNIGFDKEMKEIQDGDTFKVYNVDFIAPSKLADSLWCVSKEQSDTLLILFPKYKDKTNVFYSFRNINNICSLASKLDVRYEKKTVLSIGRFEREKRFDLLIQAFAVVLQEQPSWCLKIIGEGSLQDELLSLVNSLGLSDSVEFLGYKLNPFPYLKAANIFAFSSECEGIGNVLIEALALEVPIVSTAYPVGAVEILANGKYGLLVPPGDQHALTSGILELINNTLRYEEYKLLAKKRAFEFDSSALVPQLDKFFSDHLGSFSSGSVELRGQILSYPVKFLKKILYKTSGYKVRQ